MCWASITNKTSRKSRILCLLHLSNVPNLCLLKQVYMRLSWPCCPANRYFWSKLKVHSTIGGLNNPGPLGVTSLNSSRRHTHSWTNNPKILKRTYECGAIEHSFFCRVSIWPWGWGGEWIIPFLSVDSIDHTTSCNDQGNGKELNWVQEYYSKCWSFDGKTKNWRQTTSFMVVYSQLPQQLRERCTHIRVCIIS